MSDTRRLLLLGSTGSIGTQTLDVVSHLNALHARGEWPTRFEVVGLAAGSNGTLLAEQAAAFGVSETALAHPGDGALPSALAGARTGVDGAERLVREVEADVVLAAMVGSAGLPATLAAVELGRDVALANKETLVAAGSLVVPAAERSGSRLLPVDSEHAALWQCLQSGQESSHVCPPMRADRGVRRLILTASGGPFRTWEKARIERATPAEALNHPTWRMGPKVTIDSASLTNKALEVIEAHWLFGVPGERIDVLVHPQSTVHSFVEFEDGNVIAQLGPPDMRMPIQYAITFPLRPLGRSASLDFTAMSRLDFETPDLERFPHGGKARVVGIDPAGVEHACISRPQEPVMQGQRLIRVVSKRDVEETLGAGLLGHALKIGGVYDPASNHPLWERVKRHLCPPRMRTNVARLVRHGRHKSDQRSNHRSSRNARNPLGHDAISPPHKGQQQHKRRILEAIRIEVVNRKHQQRGDNRHQGSQGECQMASQHGPQPQQRGREDPVEERKAIAAEKGSVEAFDERGVETIAGRRQCHLATHHMNRPHVSEHPGRAVHPPVHQSGDDKCRSATVDRVDEHAFSLAARKFEQERGHSGHVKK